MAPPKEVIATDSLAVPPSRNPNHHLFNGPPLPKVDKSLIVKPTYQTLYPQEGFTVSNKIETSAVIYVPGIMTDDLRPGAQAVANMKGRPVMGIENDTHGMFKDLAACGAFATNVNWGALMESAAVQTAREALHEQISRGINPTIFAHSEGNFIVNEAIRQEMSFLLTEGRTMKEVQGVIGRMHVYRYGSPENVSEVGKSVVFEHGQDPVSKISHLIDTKHKVLNLLTGKVRDGNDVIKIKDDGSHLPVDIASHSIITYIENNPKFYDKSTQRIKPEGRALALTESIKTGFYSDPEYDLIISHMLSGAEKGEKATIAFAKALLEYAPQGVIGKYAFTIENWNKLISAASK